MFNFYLDQMSFLSTLQESIQLQLNDSRSTITLQIINQNFTFIKNDLMQSIFKQQQKQFGYLTFDSQQRILLTQQTDAILVGLWTTGVDISNTFLKKENVLPTYLHSIFKDFVTLNKQKATFSKKRIQFLYIPFLGNLQPPILLVDFGENKFNHSLEESIPIDQSIKQGNSKRQSNLKLWENFINRNSIKEVDQVDLIEEQIQQLVCDYQNLNEMANQLCRKENLDILNTSFSEAESTYPQNLQKLLHQSSQKLFTNRSYLQSISKAKRSENSHKSYEKILSIGQLSRREEGCQFYH